MFCTCDLFPVNQCCLFGGDVKREALEGAHAVQRKCQKKNKNDK